jgi:hypothetical protein
MLTRNLKYNYHGTIDMEIEHPVYGWIPFTASPNDTEKFGNELYAQAIAGDFGAIAPSDPKTAEQLAAEAQTVIDTNALVQAKGDATIQYLVHHTPDEIDAKVRQLVNAAGVTNLATATVSLKAVEDLLVRIAIALSIAAKDRLR